jgi:hypothetical protein
VWVWKGGGVRACVACKCSKQNPYIYTMEKL